MTSRAKIVAIGVVAGVLSVIALVVTGYYGRKSTGVTAVQIPPETIRYLEQLAHKLGDLTFSRKEGSGKNRSNKEDDEQADAGGFRRMATDNFLVYYNAPDKSRAGDILDYAEESKERMREVFDHFPEARNKNGRKLPIYLASSDDEYDKMTGIGNRSVACIKSDVYDDAFISTMYVSPAIFRGSDEFPRQAIVHEVAHYTHFDIVDFKNTKNLVVWFTEGLASFTAKEEYRMHELGEAYRAGRVIPLTELSAYSNAEAYSSANLRLFYSEGHSVLKMVEDRYGLKAVTSLVATSSRDADIDTATRRVLNVTLNQFNALWLNYLSSAYSVGSFMEKPGAVCGVGVEAARKAQGETRSNPGVSVVGREMRTGRFC